MTEHEDKVTALGIKKIYIQIVCVLCDVNCMTEAAAVKHIET